MTQRKKVLLAEMALLLCGVVWGSGFVVMKNALAALPVNWLLAIRFSLSGVLLSLVLLPRMRAAGKPAIKAGFLAGLSMYIAFYFQTIGLSTTTAGNNAFLTAIYVVAVPFLQWLFYKQKPPLRTFFAALICFTGVGIIALGETFSVAIGDVYTLISGLFFALHILIVAHYTKKSVNAMALTCYQFLAMALCALIMALLTDPLPQMEKLLAPSTLFSLLYLVLLCTIFAMGAQNIGIRYAPAAHASLLTSTEAPFGSLFGILLLGEPFTFRFFIGALFITGAIVWSELGAAKGQNSA